MWPPILCFRIRLTTAFLKLGARNPDQAELELLMWPPILCFRIRLTTALLKLGARNPDQAELELLMWSNTLFQDPVEHGLPEAGCEEPGPG
jgi:hypothetical protein